MTKRRTTTEFIDDATALHKGRYTYLEAIYIDARTKVSIWCTTCVTTFSQTPDSHLRGAGCPRCNVRKPKRNTDEYILLARKVHGQMYSYDKTVYVGALKMLTIGCKIHGYFVQGAKEHLRGKGCKQCGYEKATCKLTLTKEEFIRRSISSHTETYDYTAVTSPMCKIVTIRCLKHGLFKQSYLAHVRGQGCNKCGYGRTAQKKELTHENYMGRVPFHETTDYKYAVYTGMKNDVVFVCKTHGRYKQTAAAHLLAVGCKACKHTSSEGERELQQYVKSICDGAILQDRVILDGKELDIVLPAEKVAIEFNGNYYHSLRTKNKQYHMLKTSAAEANGYRLIHIRDDEWRTKKPIVKSIIANALGKTTKRIYARKCTVQEPSLSEWREFVEKNHIMGACNAKHKVGLYYEGNLVSTIGVDHKGNMVRFATILNHVVVGGLSRLLKHSTRKVEVTYCDRRLFCGKGYEAAGFQEDVRPYTPDLWFTNGPKVFNRRRFQKKNQLRKFDNFNWERTEKENAQMNGYYQLWYCGTIKYTMST